MKNNLIYLVPILFFVTSLYGQQFAPSKTGGVCFRVDDDHPIGNYQDYQSVFDKYGFKFSTAVISTPMIGDPDFVNMLKILQSDGNELMDHTPDHLLQYFTNVTDTSYYHNKKGVDHINNKKVCLSYESVDTTAFTGEGLININGDTIISVNNGEFNNLTNVFMIYLPENKLLLSITQYFNWNATNPDTLIVTSFWSEPINLGKMQNVRYHKINRFDITMMPEAIDLLIERSRSIFSQYNITLPVTFIQPGAQNNGDLFDFTKETVRDHYQKYNYKAAGLYVDPSQKCLNEYNPDTLQQYAMQWGDFLEDENSFAQAKSIIADRSARHYYSVGHSHFEGLLGGWSGYLARMDSLLSWLKQKQIPVVTYTQMANILYSAPTNPYENIFPKLNVDLDGDGLPDGYYYKAGYTDGQLDNSDGVIESGGKSFTISKKGNIAYIENLAGLEKGENEFSFYVKGAAGNIVDITFGFTEFSKLSPVTFSFPAQGSNWVKYSTSQSISSSKKLIIPDSVSIVDILISCSKYNGGTVKISGMSLMKQSTGNLNAPWNLQEDADNVDYVNLQWINNSGNATGFSIERKIDSTGTFSIIGKTGQNLTTFADNTVKSLLTYGQHTLYYRVRSYDGTDTSDYSNVVTIQRLVSLPKVYGKILYANSVLTPFNGLTLILQELAAGNLFTLTSNDTGYYQTPGIDTGKYVVRIQNLNSWDGVDATDALLISNYYLGIQSFDSLQLSAADVNNDGLINSTDAMLVLKRFISIINSFPNNKPNLVFQPVDSSCFSGDTVIVTNNGLSLNIDCLYTGDVRGAYNPTAPISKKAVSPVKLSYNPAIRLQAVNNVIEVPFILNSGLAPGAISLKIVYQQKYLTFTGIVPHEKINSAMYNQTGDTIIIGWFNSAGNKDSIVFKKGDVLLTLKFQVKMNWSPDDNSVFAILPGSEIADFKGNVINNLMLDLPAGTNILPNSYSLEQNYPNPFNNSTIIHYAVPIYSNVKLIVYNLLGQIVKQLVNKVQVPGFYSISMDDSNLCSGVYFYHIEATGISNSEMFRQSKKMVLLK